MSSLATTAVPRLVAGALPSGVTTTAPLTASAVAIPVPVEVAAVFAGALSGALIAAKRRFDVVGVMTLAVFMGLGGGIIRDVLLQKYGVVALQNPRLLPTALIAGAIGFFFASLAERSRPLIFAIDTISLSLFAIIGADKALRADLPHISAILLGTVTCVGGGMICDVLCREVPQLLRPGTFYASAAIAGSTVFVVLADLLGVVKPVAAAAAFVVIAGLRLLSARHGWRTPTPHDLSDTVADAPRRLVRPVAKRLRRRSTDDTRRQS